VLAVASGLACTAIFKPRDNVQRCGTSDDCDATGDERHVAACRFDPEHTGLDSTKIDKICVAEFKVVSCRAEDWPSQDAEDHPFQAKVDECDGIDLACTADKLGTEFCERADGGACEGNLEPNDTGLCVDPDSDEVAVSDPDFREQAVMDQFCKSFFCEDDWVCDTSSDRATCVRCDPEAEFGKGGCGLLYANGVPAPVYVLGDDLQDECGGDKADENDPLFGECP
jgi:hypothetical protein